MPSSSNVFSAVGAGSAFSVEHGDSINYATILDGEGVAYDCTLKLQRSNDGFLSAHNLTEEEMDKIVDAAIDRAFDRIAMEVGKSILKRMAWLAGAAALALAVWLIKDGRLSP